jgi:hypothetical protein
MKRFCLSIIISIIALLTLSSCGNATTPIAVIQNTAVILTDTATALPPTNTQTPDPCAHGNLETEVDKVHKHMREFDDASLLAANMARDKVSDAIANLQRIRREAEDQPIPACLTNLKNIQVTHMNSVINTLIAFMSGNSQQSIDQGISIARQQHDQYTTELARVLGLIIITATPPNTVLPAASDPSQTPNP